MKLVATTINVNNHRRLDAQVADIEAAVETTGAQVLAVQELSGPLVLPGFEVVQPRRRDGSFAGEAVVVASELETRTASSRLAVSGDLSGPGHPIRDRYVATAWVRPPGSVWVKVLAHHAPPRDYPEAVLSSSRAALRAEARPLHWIAGGDFNIRMPGARVVGDQVAGDRIDLWFASPALLAVCRRGPVLRFPERQDDHPAVAVTLDVPARRFA